MGALAAAYFFAFAAGSLNVPLATPALLQAGFAASLIGALVSLMFTGPGALSFDGHRASAAETEALGRARMRAGAP